MPQISVIVPVYRAEAYLRECIDSILSQSFSDFQLILVDDGSPDRCGAICEEYALRDSRVMVLHQENQGQAAARNHALPMAQGEWLCFVDSDDRIHPQMLELLYRAAVEGGANISQCGMLEGQNLPEDFERPRTFGYTLLTMDEDTLVSLHDREEYPGWVACAKLIRKAYVQAYPFRTGRVYEDNEAVCHWLLPAKTVASVPEELYFYRTNPESTTKSSFSLKKLDYLWALEGILAFYRANGYETLMQRFLQRYVVAAASACNGVRGDLGKPHLVKEIMANTRRFLHREKIKLTKQQRLFLLEAAYPQAMARFWSGAKWVRRLLRRGEGGK